MSMNVLMTSTCSKFFGLSVHNVHSCLKMRRKRILIVFFVFFPFAVKTSEEVVAGRARPPRQRARADMITLGSLSPQQVSYKATKRE